MRGGQKQIYFLTGTSLDEIKKSPFLEKIQARGYEVLLGSEAIDEYLFQAIPMYEGSTLQNIAKTGVKFGDEDDDEKKELEEKYRPLMDWLKVVCKLFRIGGLKRAVADVVEKIEISDLLTKSPMAIVANQFGWTGNSERLMSAQAFQAAQANPMYNFQKSQKKIVQINHGHPVIEALLDKVNAGTTDEVTSDMARSLYEMALVRSGYDIANTETFASRMEKIIRHSLGVDEDAKADVTVKPAPAKGEEPVKKSVKSSDADDLEDDEMEATPFRDEL